MNMPRSYETMRDLLMQAEEMSGERSGGHGSLEERTKRVALATLEEINRTKALPVPIPVGCRTVS